MKIGITTRKQIVNNKISYIVYERYVDLLKNHEVILLNPKQSEEIINLCDKFILVGGDDLNPRLYNQENTSSYDVCDENDILDYKIIKHAYENNKTLLGICRGIQSINTYFGGTLKQDHKNHINVKHHIMEVNKPRIYKVNKKEVNSYHHQIIDEVGKDLIVTYKSEDGVIEILEHKNKNIIGVQYHPEISKNEDDELLYNVLF